ncbi:hypothetical protein BU14_0233s0024 [Porphyra umbilicalis]|uniref:Phospholipid/glycerol acyltransferase domain-containing protein n=1 Tax=Porphyra umbilicalis TaxID=2786 RepID=A0A1X6P445_PORUM|nr:hypothetical protein BU14_0233s0024 [Porphyra umbilicalis]|eukprot:OSX75546.1 hypothetical protein BU14_0233s0024 [Porphyra umbilicalis]
MPPLALSRSSSPPPCPVMRLEDICGGLREGIDALIGDSLTQCFTAEPAEPWNFLTRSLPPGPISMRPYFAAVWLAGVWIRYTVLLPLRLATLVIGILGFFVGFFVISMVMPRRSKMTSAANKFLIRYLASVFVASWSGYVRFHGQRPTPGVNQIYVANHTSLIDVFLLIKDYPFACIGQRHGGLAGALQDLVNTVQNHVWFDREEGRDRAAVQRLLTAHVSTPGNEPMLVFPEGTCVNNRYCIMFKKGSFQLGATVFPVAIKYHAGFADPFWNSSVASFPRHLLDLMTSWAVVADVYYLPPEKQRPGEDAAAFASRVKDVIAARAGLISVGWDGFLKRHPIAPRFREQRQRATLSALSRRAQAAAARAPVGGARGRPHSTACSCRKRGGGGGGGVCAGHAHDVHGVGGVDLLRCELDVIFLASACGSRHTSWGGARRGRGGWRGRLPRRVPLGSRQRDWRKGARMHGLNGNKKSNHL